jgi:HEAT repeat protein
MEAVNRFLKLGPEQGSEVVLWLLEDPLIVDNPRARVNLAAILAHWKDPRGIPYLLEGLIASRDRGILRVVEEGLEIYGENAVIIEQLGTEYVLENPEELTRRVAFSVLSRLRGPVVLRLLARGLLDEDSEVRAMSVLGIAGFTESRDRTVYLIDALTDPDPEIRRLAWTALEDGEVPRSVSFEPEGEALDRAEAVARLRRWANVPDRTLRR